MSTDNKPLNDRLIAAVRASDLASTRQLIAEGADVNALDCNIAAALHYAAAAGDIDMVRLLLTNGADPDLMGDNVFVGHTPVAIACTHHNVQMLLLLQQHGADLSGKRHDDGLSALHCAARAGRNAICAALIDMGMPMNARDNRGWTPLHWATSYSETDTMAFLLKSGAPADQEDRSGITPLEQAVRGAYLGSIEVLLRHGARIPARMLEDSFLEEQCRDAGPDERAQIEQAVRMVRAAALSRGIESAFSPDEASGDTPTASPSPSL